MCSSIASSVSGIFTAFALKSTPHVMLYAFGKRWPLEWNICVSADLPTAGSPICEERKGVWVRNVYDEEDNSV